MIALDWTGVYFPQLVRKMIQSLDAKQYLEEKGHRVERCLLKSRFI